MWTIQWYILIREILEKNFIFLFDIVIVFAISMNYTSSFPFFFKKKPVVFYPFKQQRQNQKRVKFKYLAVKFIRKPQLSFGNIYFNP